RGVGARRLLPDGRSRRAEGSHGRQVVLVDVHPAPSPRAVSRPSRSPATTHAVAALVQAGRAPVPPEVATQVPPRASRPGQGPRDSLVGHRTGGPCGSPKEGTGMT